MAKVLFVNPLIREEDDPRHVPYGEALLAAIAIREGHQVQVFDANAWRTSDAVVSPGAARRSVGRGRHRRDHHRLSLDQAHRGDGARARARRP